jgi:hypothetical protein
MWTTEYELPPGGVESTNSFPRYMETQLWAPDAETARRYAKQRGERFKGPYVGCSEYWRNIRLPSEWLEEGDGLGAMHALCWLSMVATRAGVVTAEELLRDNGALHGMAHFLQARQNVSADSLMATLRDLEARTPGFRKYMEEPNGDQAD